MHGIWKYINDDQIADKFKLSLNEGDTPFTLCKIDNLDVGLKHEYQNPNLSFKDRSLAYQLSYYLAHNLKNFVISSSGNAAVSAAAYLTASGLDFSLDIFVADQISEKKLARIRKFVSKQIKIHQSKKPKSEAIKFSLKNNYLNLRGSQDDNALVGFKTIAIELLDQYPKMDAIFIPCSSGTSTQAIYQGFAEYGFYPQIHIIQTTKVHTIAREFIPLIKQTKQSLADAIVDHIAFRKEQISQIIKSSNGMAWVITDQELLETQNFCNEKLDLVDLSYNSILSIAAIRQAMAQKKCNFNFPVALLSGS